MGFFDYFKGRGKKRRKAGSPLGDEQEVPRCAYYIFPHVALRQFAFGSPYMCLGALGTTEGRRFLGDLLESVAEYCSAEGEAMDLEPERIRTHALRAKKYPCLIVEMPEPRAATEVYFVGIVLKPSPGDTAADLPGAEVRYFTLEKEFAPDSSAHTVLCEWTQDSKHLNYGEGPPADVKQFLKAIAEMCETEKA
jgi:hypothetical protein